MTSLLINPVEPTLIKTNPSDMMSVRKNKIQGEILETYTTEPDENGIKQEFIIYMHNDGTKRKITTTIKVEKRKLTPEEVRETNKKIRIAERKKWTKFGKAAQMSDAIGTTMSDGTVAPIDPNEGCTLMGLPVFIEKPTTVFDKKPKIKIPTGKYVAPKREAVAKQKDTKSNVYRPPNARDDYVEKNYSICISNIPDDFTKREIGNLCRSVDLRDASIKRIFIVMDRNTNKTKGIAFVHFYNENDMKYAIQALDKTRCPPNILGVEQAKDKKKTQSRSNFKPRNRKRF